MTNLYSFSTSISSNDCLYLTVLFNILTYFWMPVSTTLSTGQIRFFDEPYRGVVFESAPPGVSILGIKACFAVSSSCTEDTVEYYLSGQDSPTFTIKSSTGEITTAREVQKPLGGVYVFNAIVASSGYSADREVTVTVTTYNRYPPEFILQTAEEGFQVSLHRNSQQGTYVTTFHVQDRDSAEVNRRSRLYLTGGRYNFIFDLDRDTGVLSVGESLPRTMAESFEMVVSAQDLGSPHRETTATVRVQLSDLSGYKKH